VIYIRQSHVTSDKLSAWRGVGLHLPPCGRIFNRPTLVSSVGRSDCNSRQPANLHSGKLPYATSTIYSHDLLQLYIFIVQTCLNAGKCTHKRLLAKLYSTLNQLFKFSSVLFEIYLFHIRQHFIPTSLFQDSDLSINQLNVNNYWN
jgi:hypothetical protein